MSGRVPARRLGSCCSRRALRVRARPWSRSLGPCAPVRQALLYVTINAAPGLSHLPALSAYQGGWHALACAGAAPARKTSSRCAARAAGTLSGWPSHNPPACASSTACAVLPLLRPQHRLQPSPDSPVLHHRLGHFAPPPLIYDSARPSDGSGRCNQRYPPTI